MPSPRSFATEKTGVIIVDHGSRRAASNQQLLQVAELFRSHSGYSIVEPAHMELAEPSIDQAFRRCAAQGARLIIIHPYFLGPGRHWDEDIPRLAAAAARGHVGVRYLVTAPLGLDPRLVELIGVRIEHCLNHALADGRPCETCQGTDKCRVL